MQISGIYAYLESNNNQILICHQAIKPQQEVQRSHHVTLANDRTNVCLHSSMKIWYVSLLYKRKLVTKNDIYVSDRYIKEKKIHIKLVSNKSKNQNNIKTHVALIFHFCKCDTKNYHNTHINRE